MNKTKLIAKCLVASSLFKDENEAEHQAKAKFKKHFPSQSLHAWNTQVDDIFANNLIKIAETKDKINVKQFMLDLS